MQCRGHFLNAASVFVRTKKPPLLRGFFFRGVAAARSPRPNIFLSPAAHTSIPAKAGISFSRQREFSAKRNIAIVACRRMRLRRRDSGFRRNGRGWLARDIFSPSEKNISSSRQIYSHPPPLAGGGKNSRQRIFGGWRSADNHRKCSTPRDRFALAPPRKRRGVKKQATGSKKNRRGKKPA